jgi:hypothetical protein
MARAGPSAQTVDAGALVGVIGALERR